MKYFIAGALMAQAFCMGLLGHAHLRLAEKVNEQNALYSRHLQTEARMQTVWTETGHSVTDLQGRVLRMYQYNNDVVVADISVAKRVHTLESLMTIVLQTLEAQGSQGGKK